MKNLIVLLIMVMSPQAFSGFTPDCEGTSLGFYRNKKDCEVKTSTNCYSAKKPMNCTYGEIKDERIKDPSKPIYEAKSKVEVCVAISDDPLTLEIDETKTQEEDCREKEISLNCNGGYDKIRVADNSEVYCTRILSYATKLSGKKIIKNNVSKKEAFEAAMVIKRAKGRAIRVAFRAMNCGRRVIATLLVQNASKGLKKGQIKTMNRTYRDIKELLETGSLTSAREEILASTADGVLVTEEDKVALVAELDSCAPSI